MDDNSVLKDRGRGLEEEFFRKQDARLLEQLRQRKQQEDARAALAHASGIKNPAVLDKLAALGLSAETVAALSLVPLVEVAWADGNLDDKERTAVLEGAARNGVAAGSPAHGLLAGWLTQKPEARLLTAWTQLIEGLRAEMSAAELATLKTSLLDNARAVAGASGGILGLGSKVSGAEERMLQSLARAFG
jgi:hypothetical protein